MTLKAFAEKYGVSYTLVIEASANVEHVATMERDVDYDENDLYKAVMAKIRMKKLKVQEKIEQYNRTISRMTNVRSKEWK